MGRRVGGGGGGGGWLNVDDDSQSVNLLQGLAARVDYGLGQTPSYWNPALRTWARAVAEIAMRGKVGLEINPKHSLDGRMWMRVDGEQ